MRLYRYKSIDKALRDLENNAIYFASVDELNDPVEGYVRIYWQGDKPAWEGLLRNYICSLYQAIDLYLVKADEEFLHHKSLIVDINGFDSDPLDKAHKELSDAFLADETVKRIVEFYGKKYFFMISQNNHESIKEPCRYLKVSKEELEMILFAVHNVAMKLCIKSNRDRNLMPKDEADALLGNLNENGTASNINEVIFNSLNTAREEELAQILDDDKRNAMARVVKNSYEDGLELTYFKLGSEDDTFFYGNTDGIVEVERSDGKGKRKDVTKARQHRNWLSVAVDFPKIYIDELREMVYPPTYFACFTGKNDDSAMWGNYADNHKGVCLVYEVQNGIFNLMKPKVKTSLPVKPVIYGDDVIERNFFNTLGRLSVPQIQAWLTGTDGLSECYSAFFEDSWREQYWADYGSKNHRKLKAWEYEAEYRLELCDMLTQHMDVKNRVFNCLPDQFKGVVFGINTSEYDKKRIVEKVAKLKRPDDFTFYQAEYDDMTQKIVVRKKSLWKLKSNH